MPRSVSPRASPPKLVTPAACSSAITGARSATRASEAARRASRLISRASAEMITPRLPPSLTPRALVAASASSPGLLRRFERGPARASHGAPGRAAAASRRRRSNTEAFEGLSPFGGRPGGRDLRSLFDRSHRTSSYAPHASSCGVNSALRSADRARRGGSAPLWAESKSGLRRYGRKQAPASAQVVGHRCQPDLQTGFGQLSALRMCQWQCAPVHNVALSCACASPSLIAVARARASPSLGPRPDSRPTERA